jgi:acylphosphatase
MPVACQNPVAPMHGIRAIVEGRVQRVGFRAFAQRLAFRHGLDGEVWNRSDGSVELIAFHQDPAVLRDFVRELHLGPGRVEAVRTFAEPGEPDEAGFTIGPTR